jgi:2,3-bisphosphoglycerate-independent phosphoglycerate mutase
MNDRFILVILDGFGASAMEEGNAVLAAKTMFLDYLWGNFPKTLLHASGEEVGLSWGEIGNSEVGHLNLGTGRISEQDLPRINATIEDGSFFENNYFIDACNHVKKNNSTLHLLGLLSNGCVHADIGHVLALIKMAKMQNIKKLAIHGITDGRDMAKQSAQKLLDQIQQLLDKEEIGKIATLVGRFYAMDRDNNWDRIEKAYNLITKAEGEKFVNYSEALKSRYGNKEDDETLLPIVLDEELTVKDDDAIIFFNFRADRAKELSEPFISLDFKNFSRKKFAKNVRFITFTSYGNEQTPLVDVAYLAEKISHQLAGMLSDAKLKQFHIAESEKYAHVTYFFNGGVEKPFLHEERTIVPSPKVKSYDLKPEMSAETITNEFIKNWESFKPQFAVINFANPDMVGHTGNYKATVSAIEIVDKCIGKLLKDCKDELTSIIITADHGNAEQMVDPVTKAPDKQHTTNDVPFVYIDKSKILDKNLASKISYEEKIGFFGGQATGVLADIAPTVLAILNIKKPSDLTGINLKDVI